ncbi:MAG: hypothetical protein WCV85_01535 [Patescibacteria group bacterium]
MKFLYAILLIGLACFAQLQADSRIRFTAPTTGFFCEQEYFCVEIDSRATPAPLIVTLECRDALDDTARWEVVGSDLNTQGPWCFNLPTNDCMNVREGFYYFRAFVIDAHANMTYSDAIALFYDNSSPATKLLSISDGITEKPFTSGEEIVFPVGTEVLSFTFQAIDNLSSWGPSPVYNSGVSAIVCGLYAEDAIQNGDGTFTYTYDVPIQGAPTEPLTFTVYDAVGCNETIMQAWVTLR